MATESLWNVHCYMVPVDVMFYSTPPNQGVGWPSQSPLGAAGSCINFEQERSSYILSAKASWFHHKRILVTHRLQKCLPWSSSTLHPSPSAIPYCSLLILVLEIDLTGRVAVEGEEVGGAAWETAEGAADSGVPDVAAQRLGGPVAVQRQKVGSKTGDVGRRHGGAGDGVLAVVSSQAYYW